MITKLVYFSLVSMLLLTGCARNNGPEYDGNSYSQIKKVDTGVVIKSRPVPIKDDGSGKFLGAVLGAVLGSTVGHNSGKTLAVLGGGLVGGYAGNEVGKSNALELTVELDDGKTVVVVVKHNNIVAGDRIRIIKDGNKASQVDKIDY